MQSERIAIGRRGLLQAGAGIGLISALAGCAQVIPQDVGLALTPDLLTDPAVLNFALNLEYLEAEYYTRGVTGQGLDAALLGPNPGPVAGGRQVRFSDPVLAAFAAEIMRDEQEHVRFLYEHTRNSPVTQIGRPALDLQQAFRTAGAAAGLDGDFDPFANETAFYLGAFLFEDVGVSAYTGAAKLIADKQLLSAAAGIQGVEAYHAGLVRAQLAMMGGQARQAADAISAARARLSGPQPSDTPLNAPGGGVHVACADSNGIAWARTPQEVLRIAFLNPGNDVNRGGFFPAGIRGVVTKT